MSKVVVASDLDGRCLVSMVLWLRSPKKIGENQFDFSDKKMWVSQVERIGDEYRDGPITRTAAGMRALESACKNGLTVIWTDGLVSLSEQGRRWNYEYEVKSE